jgi:hypothetical protein
MPNNKTCRVLLAVLSLSITIFCVGFTLYRVNTASLVAGIEDLPFNELTSKSVDTQLDLAKTLFDLALLMIAALWGLVIAKKDEIQLVSSQRSTVIMFFCASGLLLLSAYSYGSYLRKISSYFADASAALTKSNLPLSVPDIFDQNVNHIFVWQYYSLVAGILNGVLTLVSAHRLKDD